MFRKLVIFPLPLWSRTGLPCGRQQHTSQSIKGARIEDWLFIYFFSIRSWGDWFNCLHVRMGLPNWLLVSTVSLGVIFTLWLCLVIPSNPPKQKVKAARVPKNVNVKELEANGHIATIIMPPPAADLEKVQTWIWEGNQTTFLHFLKLIFACCRKIGTEISL